MIADNNNELIYLESLKEFCDFVWGGEAMKVEPASGVIWVHNDNVASFFRRCRSKRYIVVSGNSDFSLHYQAEHHPNIDLYRMSKYCQWQKAASVTDQYASIHVGPACNPQECDARDKYSLKTFCWTKSTFPAIPDNIVHWFVANTNINDDPRIEWIPYGLSPGKGTPKAEQRGKHGLLYVNFQNFTDERVALNQFFATKDWATHSARNDYPVEEYWQDIADHKFVLCPAGNGLDCYRNWETLYLGSIPVMRRTPFSENFRTHGLPVVLVDSLFDLTPSFLHTACAEMEGMTFCLESLKLCYWKNRIQAKRSEL